MPRGVARRNRMWGALPQTRTPAHMDVQTTHWFGTYTANQGDASFGGNGYIRVENTGVEPFAGVSATPRYLTGGTGWLSLNLSGNRRVVEMTATIDPSALSDGVHTAEIVFADAASDNSGVAVPVSLAVLPTTTTMAVTPSSVTATADAGQIGSQPTFTVSNAGGVAVLGIPAAGAVTYASGANWITSVTFTGPTGGPYTGTVRTTAATLAAGSYTASFPVTCGNATNAPLTVTVGLTVAAVTTPSPTMALSASTWSPTVQAGTATAQQTTITVSSGNGQSIGTTGVGTITGTGATGVTASVNGHVVTLSATAAALSAGTYSATVPITDTLATNSPQNVTVSLTVTAASSPGANVAGEVTLEASTPGAAVLVSSPWPLPPGYMTAADVAARKGAMFVNGVEVACYVEACRGRHADGSLRAVLLQFTYALPDNTPVACEFRTQTTRTPADPTKTNVTRDVWLNTSVTPYARKAMAVPTDPAYLCATLVSGMPLIPASQDDADSFKMYAAYFDDRYEALKNVDATNNSASKDYDQLQSLVAMWCRTGNTKYLRTALSKAYYFWTFTNDTTPSAFTPTHNLESITGGSGIGVSEPKTQRAFLGFIGYYLTGWPSFYAQVNAGAQQAQTSGNAYGYASRGNNPIYWGPRFNASFWCYLLPAVMMDATRTMNNPSGAGVSGTQLGTQAAKLWTDGAAEPYVESNGGSGWRNGYWFVNPGYRDDGTGTPGDWPLFQSALMCRYYVLYYTMIHADPRLPTQIKREVDGMIRFCKQITSTNSGAGSDRTSFTVTGAFAGTYSITQPRYAPPYMALPQETSGSPQAYNAPYWAPAVAFVHKFYGGNAPDGVSYLEWFRRVCNVGHVYHQGSGNGPIVWNWEIFGLTFGGAAMMTSWIMAQSGPPQGPATLRTPTVYSDWPS